MNSQVNSIDPGSRTPQGPAEVYQCGLTFTGRDSAAAAYCARSREPGPVPGLTSLRGPAPGVGSRAARAPVAVA